MNSLNFGNIVLFLKVSELLLLRLPAGTIVRVNSPAYAAGLMGVIQGHERGVSRWIIRLEANPFENNKQAVLLSLEASEFEIIELPPLRENKDNNLVKE